jgi:hypothetical protein
MLIRVTSLKFSEFLKLPEMLIPGIGEVLQRSYLTHGVSPMKGRTAEVPPEMGESSTWALKSRSQKSGDSIEEACVGALAGQVKSCSSNFLYTLT